MKISFIGIELKIFVAHKQFCKLTKNNLDGKKTISCDGLEILRGDSYSKNIYHLLLFRLSYEIRRFEIASEDVSGEYQSNERKNELFLLHKQRFSSKRYLGVLLLFRRWDARPSKHSLPRILLEFLKS